MKNFLLFIAFNISVYGFAKEWKSLSAYQKETKRQHLEPSDWLKSDRKKNTIVWQNANNFNLKNILPKEYKSIAQRRDFYQWYYLEIIKKGHKVIWPTMAYFISKKLQLTNAFPYRIFLGKDIKTYSILGSENVFNNCFSNLKELFFSDKALQGNEALQWDKDILHQEQFVWISEIYSEMNKKTLKKLERIAKGKCIYSLMIPKKIRFQGKLENEEERFKYAIQKLRPYTRIKYH